jgi:hypothetical protein|tara:strand:+ start:514 stop:909 length:396 start_codon:yes stop_codon:yes gene_type:complete
MWSKIIEIKEWFGEVSERYQLVKSFNRTAKYSFISGTSPTLLEAKITKGDSEYRHAFSKWRGGGFRIKALSGRELERSELIEIGRVILDNEPLIREMISLGWDTLEVHGNIGNNGSKWSLKEFANIGAYIN